MLGEDNGTPLQYSCLENPMDGGAWQAAVQGVAESRTRPSDFLLSLSTFLHWRRKWQPTPVILPGESQGRGNLVGCHLWGHTESDTTEATPWTAACQAPPSMGFSRQEYWSGVPLPSPKGERRQLQFRTLTYSGAKSLFADRTWWLGCEKLGGWGCVVCAYMHMGAPIICVC